MWFHQIDVEADKIGTNYEVGLAIAKELSSCFRELDDVRTFIFRLQNSLTMTAQLVQKEFGCKYESENGVKCIDLAVEEVASLPCCKNHATIRRTH